MTVITIESFMNVIFWSILWYLSKNNISGYIIQNLIWITMLIFTLMTQLFALLSLVTCLKLLAITKKNTY